MLKRYVTLKYLNVISLNSYFYLKSINYYYSITLIRVANWKPKKKGKNLESESF